MATESQAVVRRAAYLLPNTDAFKWRGKIVRLPGNLVNASKESKDLFMKILNQSEIFNPKMFSPSQVQETFNKAWLDYLKNTPISVKDQFIKSTLLVIDIAGMAILFVIGARACL